MIVLHRLAVWDEHLQWWVRWRTVRPRLCGVTETCSWEPEPELGFDEEQDCMRTVMKL